MKIRKNRFFNWDLENSCVTIQLTPQKSITVKQGDYFTHAPMSGWSGFTFKQKTDKGIKNHRISSKIARVLHRYLKFTGEQFDYDRFIIDFSKITQNSL